MKITTTLILISALILSWFLPPFKGLWAYLDKHTFLILNHSLLGHPQIQQVTAWLNSRYADWLFEGIIITLYLGYALIKKDISYLKKLGLVIATIAVSQVLINKLIFFNLLHISRESPSLVLGTSVDLSIFPYLNNKVASVRSFPADHATTLFLCSMFSFSHFKKPAAAMVTAMALLLTLPRLIGGAHWLSDVVMGGLCIALFAWSMAEFYFPSLQSPSQVSTVMDSR
ncbi:MAG: phosphatase PAP2 family protein [Chlamydiota bacterium]